MGVGGACGSGWSMWGWVDHVGVVEYVRVGGACEGGWSMWGERWRG